MHLEQKRRRVFLTRRRKYSLNEGAFEALTEEAAYWVGFIMADGCISCDRTPDCRRLRINLKTTDAEHLQRLRSFLQYEGPVATRDNGRYCALEVNSARLVSSLKQYGVIEKKSRRASVIHLDTNLHFWRGMIDGDGTLYLSKNMYPAISLCGSEVILSQFVAYVKSVFPFMTKLSIRKRASIKQVAVAGKKAITLTHHFYGDCSIALERKLKTAKIIIGLRPD
ncbi:MAG TPA: hypothetical protein VF546_08475 [Pyrinomonadaceae bacterium]|jgi:hypothetical protein